MQNVVYNRLNTVGGESSYSGTAMGLIASIHITVQL